MQQQQVYRYPSHAATVHPRSARRVAVARRSSRQLNRIAVATAGLLMAISLCMGLLAVGLYVYFNLFSLIAPGVMVGEMRLGGMNVEQAAARLNTEWHEQPPVALSDGERVWTAPAAQLGFQIDAAATAERAYTAGRSASGWINPLALLRQNRRQVEPAVTFNSDLARFRLEQAAAVIDTAPMEASLSYQDGRWQSSPGKPGAMIDVAATLLTWQAAPEALLRQAVLPLTVRSVTPRVLDASEEAARLNALMRQPLRVEAFDAVSGETITWEVPGETLAQWVTVGEGNGQAAIRLDAQAVLASLRNWESKLDPGEYFAAPENLDNLSVDWQAGRPISLLVRHAPTEYVVQAGDNMVSIAFRVGVPFWMIQRANPDVNSSGLSAGQTLVIPSLDDNLPLPVVRSKRIVISISQQRMWTYENGQQRSESVISTGISRSPTMPGVYQVRTHELEAYASIWDLYMPHFLGIYEAVPGFMNGIHGLPMLSSGVRLWGSVLGSPASYGCIIMTLQEAEDLYHWAEAGVVVEIQR